MFVKSKEIVFHGWLEKQLRTQVDGLFGSLDRIWKDIRDSKWLGGNEEGWERFPYYLNGLIPLAYALKDEELIAKANKYIDIIISSQKEDGRICPINDTDSASDDIWPVFLLLKVLAIYGEVSGNDNADEAILKGLQYVDKTINGKTIINWAHARYFEGFVAMHYLKQKHKGTNKFFRELAIKLKSQGLDYASCINLWHDSRSYWAYDIHGVNIAMALKANILYKELTGIDDGLDAKTILKLLDENHGNAYGHFNADECLAPYGPNYGSELCCVVEAMYSYELLFNLTNDKYWLERLEELTYNGLAATISDDMWAHQYDQQVNQLNCAPHNKVSFFKTNNEEANMFGLEPHFGCCTANFGQGWPLFALSTYSVYKQMLQINMPVAATIQLESGLVLECQSEYPFKKNFILKANKDTKVRIKVPSYAKLKGYRKTKDGFAVINLAADKPLELTYHYDVRLEERKNNFGVIKYGPLLFSLPIKAKESINEYVKNNVERKFPYCDYHYELAGEWRYGINGKKFKVIECEYDKAFSRKNPPLKIEGEFALLDWRFKGKFKNIPQDNYQKVLQTKLVLQMQPYGATYLRMTEMPIIKEEK